MTGLDPQQGPALVAAQSRLAVQRTQQLLDQTWQVVTDAWARTSGRPVSPAGGEG